MEDKIKEKIIRNLNYHGYFFNGTIENILKENGWITFPEQPLPSSIKLDRKNIVDSVDIYALKEIKRNMVYLIIECKKVNIDVKKWIFFKADKNTFNIWYIEAINTGRDNFEFSKLYDEYIHILGKNAFMTLIGKEINIKEPTKNYPTDNIYKASLQCSYSLHSFKEKFYQNFIDDGLPVNNDKYYFFPIIVTNSRLYTCEFKINNSTLEKGTVHPKNIKLSKRDFVIFNFGLPMELYFSSYDFNHDYESDDIDDLSILIVHSKYFKSLLDLIESYFNLL